MIIDNNSDEPETLDYLRTCQCGNVRVIEYPHEFNYPSINDFAVKQTQSEVVVLLNNDTEVCNPGWLQELVSHAIRPEGGAAVGAKLFYAEDLIQRAGLLLGMGGDELSIADHAFKGMHKNDTGSLFRSRLIQAYSAATARKYLKRDDGRLFYRDIEEYEDEAGREGVQGHFDFDRMTQIWLGMVVHQQQEFLRLEMQLKILKNNVSPKS